MSDSIPQSKVPVAWCREGKHTYMAIVNQCPFHRGVLWNVRVKARHEIFRTFDHKKVREWTYQQMAANPKAARVSVLASLFGWNMPIETIGKFILDVEVWRASAVGISPRDITRGTAE